MSESAAGSEQPTRRVLVVEDDEGLRSLIVRSLKKAGFGVEGVATGTEAVERIAEDRSLVLLLDQRLPGMSGSDLVRLLAERGIRVPFVMMTGQGDERLAVEIMKLGAADYLLKDLELTDRLPGVLERLFRSLDTEQRLLQAEEALRESESRFRSIAEQLSDLISITDSSGVIAYASPASLPMFGLPPEEMVGLHFAEFLAPGQELLAMTAFRDTIEHGLKIIGIELSIKRKDGSLFFGEVDGVRYHSHGELGALVTIRDITERKRAEERLRFNSMVLDQIQDCVMVVDLNGRITFANEAECRMTKRSRAELIGSHVESYGEDSSQGPAQREIMEKTLAEGYWDGELTRCTVDGAEVLLHCRTQTIHDASGEVVAVCSISTDITERKALEARLTQAQKMESVGRLAGGVAHDFNNMLGVILGHAEMSLEALDSSHPIHGNLEEIRKAAERSAALTGQMLAFARKQTVAPKVVDLNGIVEGMLRMLGRLIGEGIDLTWAPGADLWPVRVDPSQIDQILANLCVNARDAVGSVGRVTIETANAEFDAVYRGANAECVPGEYVLLAVSDDGCGMDREALSHLFEPFFTTKAPGEGTGLGLATVYGIVKQNEGFLHVYSEPGLGTTFKVYLPRHRGGHAPAPDGLPARHGVQGGRPFCWSKTSPPFSTSP